MKVSIMSPEMQQNSEIVNWISETFTQYFLSQNFKIKKTSEVVIAIQKKSVVELWLPETSRYKNANYTLFRLSLDLKTIRDFLIIMNNEDGNFSFKLVNRLKMESRGNYNYPKYDNFSELLNAAVDESSHQNSFVENEPYQNEYSEESITVLRPSPVF